jgi:hypothetical protein
MARGAGCHCYNYSQPRKREGHAIVQPGLSRKRKTYVIFFGIVRRANLHLLGQHGIGGGEHGTQQNSRSWR